MPSRFVLIRIAPDHEVNPNCGRLTVNLPWNEAPKYESPVGGIVIHLISNGRGMFAVGVCSWLLGFVSNRTVFPATSSLSFFSI